MPARPDGPDDGRNIRLTLEYDGTDFAGWQIQAQERTVQGELSRALGILLHEPVRPTGAGRTDAGTHALGQVAHFRTHSDLPLERLQRGLNGLLPPDVAVRSAEEAAPEFHARYSARGKRYRYRICTSKPALNRRYVWAVHRPLDAAAMQQAAMALCGTHAFGAFCKQDPVPSSLVCRVTDCLLVEREGEIVLEIEADRFLRHMVRRIAGTLAQIGAQRRPPGSLAELLVAPECGAAGVTAPARGLCLLEVYYGPLR
ncbi:MAG: tRNA pseudouridine(38-40) synthase TruA [Candidatus Latescibacterota bacterium]